MTASPAVNPLYVDKKLLLVHLQLTNGVRIRGYIHLAPRIRLTDTLNFQANDKPFLPVTNAQIITRDGQEFSAPFIVINRGNIISCIPQEKIEG